ncbi:MAG: Uma2 family endonuclease [Cyanobacteria bacterium P01_F01_bin.42]
MVQLNVNPSIKPSDHEDILQGLPTNLESNEPPLESDLHREQIDLLIRLLKYWWQDRTDFYISGNLTVYYNQKQLKTRDFRGPDIFIVLGAEQKERRSWVIWEEGGKYPDVVIELLSDSTASVDRGLKKNLYQSVWRVPNYFWFHPGTCEFKGLRLVAGQYEELTPNEDGRLWSDQLNLFLGIDKRQLRWYDENGHLIPLPEEQERQAKEQERQAKELAEQRVQQLEEVLRSQGIDPDAL